ncbi:MAG: DUF1631 domain-containing protein [Proteobacteria bacterium]|nr:DUF1631 domain-containing protein [Pseudomonadota bacterium]
MLINEQINSPAYHGGGTVVYESVRRFALKRLSDLIRVLMENIDDALFELSEKAETDRQHNMYFEAMREIRRKSSLLQIEFNQAMEDCFNQFCEDQAADDLDEDIEELTLVELEDMEDTIAIGNMISRARPLFEEELFAVTERLKVVLHLTEIDRDLNPLDPKAICESFHKASEVIDSEIQIKLIFYKLFDKFVMNSLDGFYRELNTLFIDKGVLPKFQASKERENQASNFLANRVRNSTSDPAHDTPTGEQAAWDPQPAPNAGTQTDQGNLLPMLRQVISPTSSHQVVAESEIHINGQPGEGTVDTGRLATVVPIAQNTEYMSALTNLQTYGLQSQPLESIDPQEARAETRQQLLAFNKMNADHASPADNQIIDIVSMIFDFFFDDDALPAPIKVLIGRLQIPILKVAFIDDSFFKHNKHPARKLLDSISKASLGWGEDLKQEKVLIDKLEEVVNSLVNEFEQDIGVFDRALEDIRQFLADENEKARKADELLKKQELERERLEKEAQDSATSLIRKLTKNRELSIEVTGFLDSIWNPVLFHIYLTMGESSSHWNNIRRISSTFVWTLVPKYSKEERVKILDTLPSLLRALSRGMDLIAIDDEAQNKIFQMLAKQHAKTVKQTSKNIVTRIDDNTIWPDGNAAGAFAGYTRRLADQKMDIELAADEAGAILTDEEEYDPDGITIITESSTNEVIKNLDDFTDAVKKGEIEVDQEITMDSGEHAADSQDADDFLRQAQALEIGAWVEFLSEEDKTFNARLSWKSRISHKYVFANRLGHKLREVTMYGFATELRSGRAKLIQSYSLFDRAVDTLISKITH